MFGSGSTGRSSDTTDDTIEHYQDWVWNTTTPKEGDNGGWWACSGMAAEAGESLALFEKSYRKGVPVDRDTLMDELGDVLWFLVATCNMMDIDFKDVLMNNVHKINTRQAKGMVTSEDCLS